MVHADLVYIQHILDAIQRIDEYLQGVSEEMFYEMYLVQDGVIRQLEIIGEATKQISQETRDANEQIPWKDMAGMRDKLIHAYFGVDMELIWLTATSDIPFLRREIEKTSRSLQ